MCLPHPLGRIVYIRCEIYFRDELPLEKSKTVQLCAIQHTFTYNYKATLIVCKNERARKSALRHAVATQGADKALEIYTGIYCICRLDCIAV